MLRTSDEPILEPARLSLLSEPCIYTSLPAQMIINLINRMTSISIIHATPPAQHIFSTKSGGSNLMMNNKFNFAIR